MVARHLIRHLPAVMTALKALLLALAALIGAVAVPAHAQATAYAAGQGPLNRIEVGVDVRASVRDRCGFATGGAPAGSTDQAEFDRLGIRKDFVIRLNCTGASRIAVSSTNGGLAPAATVPGYAASAPYTVELKMIADNGSAATATCDAAKLKAASECLFSGSAGTTKGLLLNAASTKANGSYLRVSAPAYTGSAPLLAGSYSDTLVITVSIAP